MLSYAPLGLNIDFSDLQTLKILGDLSSLYKKIPDTKCLHCPSQKKVTAQCCHTFSPPMFLIEFVNIYRQIEKKNKEEKLEIILSCFESFVNPALEKQCVLLSKNRCLTYEQRQTSCRLFGQYSKSEWQDRLDLLTQQLDVPAEEVPFYNQCLNIKVDKNKNISKAESDLIFKNIRDLDVLLFPDRAMGKRIVDTTMTYIPFDAHMLASIVGYDNMEKLTDVKLMMRGAQEKFKKGEISVEELEKTQGNFKMFCDVFREMLMLVKV
jgi:Fe-S-cluster containining protein